MEDNALEAEAEISEADADRELVPKRNNELQGAGLSQMVLTGGTLRALAVGDGSREDNNGGGGELHGCEGIEACERGRRGRGERGDGGSESLQAVRDLAETRPYATRRTPCRSTWLAGG